MIHTNQISVKTIGRGFHELTFELRQVVADSAIKTGLCHAYIQHTSASLIVCENADPAVLRDLERFMSALVVDGDPRFEHDAEGADDMPAHIRSVLTHCDLTVPIHESTLALGTWQGVYLWEHRARPHRRDIALTLMGEA